MLAHCEQLAYRLGLKPWEAARCQPVDLHRMTEGAAWRFSRGAEVVIVAAAIIGNRIPFNEKAVEIMETLKAFPLYREQ